MGDRLLPISTRETCVGDGLGVGEGAVIVGVLTTSVIGEMGEMGEMGDWYQVHAPVSGDDITNPTVNASTARTTKLIPRVWWPDWPSGITSADWAARTAILFQSGDTLFRL